jgi:hypothetical protein
MISELENTSSMHPARILLSLHLLSVLAAGADTDHVLGKWKLNWERSHSSAQAPKSVIRTYATAADGVRVSEDWIDADGKVNKQDYTAKYDGKEYAIAYPIGGSVVFTRHNAYVAEGLSKANNLLAYTFKRMVSKDRKTLIIEMRRKDPAGKKSKEVLVYDRIE